MLGITESSGGSSGSGGADGPATSASFDLVFMSRERPELDERGDEIVVMNLDGSNRRRLTDNDRHEFLPHFSPDGARLVYTKYTNGAYGVADSKSNVAVLELASGK